MNKATSTLIAAAAALALSGAAYAQSNNTLATPSTVSPVHPSSGYGTPGATSSESGTSAASANANMAKSVGNSSASVTPAYGTNNTLATPSTMSPAH
jgi:hypothetical protein